MKAAFLLAAMTAVAAQPACADAYRVEIDGRARSVVMPDSGGMVRVEHLAHHRPEDACAPADLVTGSACAEMRDGIVVQMTQNAEGELVVDVRMETVTGVAAAEDGSALPVTRLQHVRAVSRVEENQPLIILLPVRRTDSATPAATAQIRVIRKPGMAI